MERVIWIQKYINVFQKQRAPAGKYDVNSAAVIFFSQMFPCFYKYYAPLKPFLLAEEYWNKFKLRRISIQNIPIKLIKRKNLKDR